MVRQQIRDEIHASGMISIVADTTPDIVKREQLSIVARYLKFSSSTYEFEIKERVLDIVEVETKTALDCFNGIENVLNKMNITWPMVIGQCYDNGSNMTGHIKGVRALVQGRNPAALFVACNAHTLDLVGKSLQDSSIFALKLFESIASLYSFFNDSQQRWHRLGVHLMSISKTRWSYRHLSARAVKNNLPVVLENLLYQSENATGDARTKLETQTKAASLFSYFSSSEAMIMLRFWIHVTGLLQEANLKFQDIQATLVTQIRVLDDTKQAIAQIDCEEEIQLALEEASYIDGFKDNLEDIYDSSHVMTRAERARVSKHQKIAFARQLLIDEMNEVIDYATSEIDDRFYHLESIFTMFNPILTSDQSDAEVIAAAAKFHELDPSLDSDILVNEHSAFFATYQHHMSASEILELIRSDKLPFYSLAKVVQWFLSIATSSASCERVFSKQGCYLCK